MIAESAQFQSSATTDTAASSCMAPTNAIDFLTGARLEGGTCAPPGPARQRRSKKVNSTITAISPGARAYPRAGLANGPVSGLLWLFLLVGLGMPPAFCETWTNAAGHPIDAELKDVIGQTVLLRTPNGKDLRLPLKSLSKADRRHALAATGKTPIPTAVQQAYQHTSAALRRARQFRDGGKITAAEFANRRKRLLELFETQCAEYTKRPGSDALPASAQQRLTKQLSAL